MRKTLMMSAALLALEAGVAQAQMNPPPNATAPLPSMSPSTGAGSVTAMPRATMPGAAMPGAPQGTMQGNMPAAAPAPMTPAAAPSDTGMTGMRPMRGQARHAMPAASTARATPARAQRRAAPGDDGVDAPRSGDYRGGAGSPLSNNASNTGAANTRSEIAPRLPDPNAAANTPEAYLSAAQRALAAGRTGAAQEALERAETRILTRSTDPSMAASPADMPMVQQISQARQALANRDVAGARAAIATAMGNAGEAPMEPMRPRRR